jgi:antibiotic biosynthesis monooxygenase (ABM) superfamily enzyme
VSDQPHQPYDSPPPDTDGPVTTTVIRRVKPGHEPFYEQFLEGIIAAAARFPGHLGVEVFRPQSVSTGEYRVTLGPLVDDLGLVPRLAVTTAVTVPIMTWLVMPRVTRLLHSWLHPTRTTYYELRAES